MHINDITSLTWLHGTCNRIQLVAFTANNPYGYRAFVSREQFEAAGYGSELKKLFLQVHHGELPHRLDRTQLWAIFQDVSEAGCWLVNEDAVANRIVWVSDDLVISWIEHDESDHYPIDFTVHPHTVIQAWPYAGVIKLSRHPDHLWDLADPAFNDKCPADEISLQFYVRNAFAMPG